MNQEGNSELEQRSVELSINEVQTNDGTQPVVINVEVPSNDLAERMANAFDRNLDKLIEDVQAPPPPIKIKKPKKVKGVKVKKVRAVKIKQYAYKPKEGKDSSFNAFLGRKIGSAFSLAATARRNAKLAGEETKPKGYFLKKALGFEFGGDLVNRTRGMFSNDPTTEQDPSLSKGQRFAAKLQRPEAPLKVNNSIVGTPYTQPSLFDTSKYVTVVDNSLGQHIQRSVKKLQNCFDRVNKTLSNITLQKNKTKETVIQENTIVESLSEKFLQVKESIKENTVLQKTLNTLKLKDLNVIKKAEEKRKAAAKEAELEKGKDLSGGVSYDDPYANVRKGKGLLERAWDFIAGNDDEDDGGGGDDGGPNIDIDLPDRGSRRPGAKRRLARRKFNATRRNIGERIGKIGEGIAEKGGRAGKFLQRQGGRALNFGRKAGERALDAGKTGLLKAGKFIAENPKILRVGKALGGFVSKFIPGVGIVAGGADAAYRTNTGDKTGAALAGFGASADALAATSTATFVGAPVGAAATIASWGSDIGLLGYDLWNAFTTPDKPTKKMSEGGMVKLARGGMVPAMVGEAGPELITPASPFVSMPMMMGSNPAAASIATILGATSSVIDSAGPSAAAVKPFIKQTISPLARIYGKPELNIQTKVGNNLGNVKEPDKNGGILGLFKKLIAFFTGGEADDGEEGSGGDNGNGNDNNFNGGGGDWAPILGLIRKAEGGYESIAGKSPIKGLTDWTIQKVADSAPSYAGAYQLDPRSVIGWAKDVGLKPEDKFSPANQDKIAVGLIEGRAQGKKWRSKQISDEQFGNNLATIWAGLPVLSPTNGKQRGSSYYAGTSWNKANVKPEEIEGALKQIGSDGSSTTAANPATPPINPGNPGNNKPQSPNSKSKSSTTPSLFNMSSNPASRVPVPGPSVSQPISGGINILGGGSRSSSMSSGGYNVGGGYIGLSSPLDPYITFQQMRLANN